MEPSGVSCSVSLSRFIAEAGANGRSEAEDLIDYLLNDIGVSSIGYDHIRSVATDVFGLPQDINKDYAPPPKLDDDPDNRHKRTGDILLDLDEVRDVNKRLLKYEDADVNRLTMRRLQVQADIKEHKTRAVDCLAGYVDCVIYPTGEVAACEFTKPFSNLKEFDFDLEKLWHSHVAEEMRKKIQGCACTHPCHLSDSLWYDADFLKFYASKDSAGKFS